MEHYGTLQESKTFTHYSKELPRSMEISVLGTHPKSRLLGECFVLPLHLINPLELERIQVGYVESEELWKCFMRISAFNQDIGRWNTSQVNNMNAMFR